MILVEVAQVCVGFVQVSQGWIGGEVQIGLFEEDGEADDVSADRDQEQAQADEFHFVDAFGAAEKAEYGRCHEAREFIDAEEEAALGAGQKKLALDCAEYDCGRAAYDQIFEEASEAQNEKCELPVELTVETTESGFFLHHD